MGHRYDRRPEQTSAWLRCCSTDYGPEIWETISCEREREVGVANNSYPPGHHLLYFISPYFDLVLHAWLSCLLLFHPIWSPVSLHSLPSCLTISFHAVTLPFLWDCFICLYRLQLTLPKYVGCPWIVFQGRVGWIFHWQVTLHWSVWRIYCCHGLAPSPVHQASYFTRTCKNPLSHRAVNKWHNPAGHLTLACIMTLIIE